MSMKCRRIAESMKIVWSANAPDVNSTQRVYPARAKMLLMSRRCPKVAAMHRVSV